MQIDFVLRFHIDDPSSGKRRRLAKRVTMTAPHVPRMGERMVVPGEERTNVGAHKIVDVIYTETGTVLLDFNLEGLLVGTERQVNALLTAGFHEVPDATQVDS